MPDKVFTNNQVIISGEVVSEFVFSHEVYGEGFYNTGAFSSEIKRCV